MIRHRGVYGWLVVGALVGWQAVLASAAGPVDELASRLPDQPNAVVALHVAKILDSPIGKAEGWREKYTSRFESGPLMVPPHATDFLLAADLELASMSPRWEAAVFNLSTSPTMDQIAKVVSGHRDTVQNRPAVYLNDQSYLLQLGEHQYGVLRPANRQDVNRWAKALQGAPVKLSPYLQQAIGYSDNVGTEIILALDMSGMLNPDHVRERVQSSKLRDAVKADEDQIVKLLTSVEGITFGVRAADKLVARLKIDFSEDVTPLAPITKPLIINLLRQSGAALPEMEEWQVDSAGKRLSLRGNLSGDGLRRILSLIHVDASVVQDAERVSEPAANEPGMPEGMSEEQARAYRATRRYFRHIETYVKDLGNPRVTDFSQVGLWMQNYSRRIQALQTSNVDQDVVAFGQKIVDQMNQTVNDLYGISQDASTQAAAIGPGVNIRMGALPTRYNMNFGGHMMWRYAPIGSTEIDTSAISQRAAVEQQAINQSAQVAQQRMTDLGSQLEQMRSTLNERYGKGF